MRYLDLYLFILLWLFAFISPFLKKGWNNLILALYCGIWSFVFGFRRIDVGNDTRGYTAYFENINPIDGYGTIDNPGETIEIGFVFISRVFGFFSDSALLAFFLIALFEWRIIYLYYKKFSNSSLLALLYMLTISGSLIYTIGIATRQIVSTVILCFGIFYIMKSNAKSGKELLKRRESICGILLCLLSVTIHRTTALLVVFFPLMYFVKMTKNRAYIFTLSFSIISLVASKYISVIFDLTLLMIGGISDEKISLLGERYMGDGTKGISLTSWIAWIVPTILTIRLTKKEKINTFFFKVLVFVFCLHQIIQYSNMHDRLLFLFVLLGFTCFIPEVCGKNRRWYYVYLMWNVILLVLDYRIYQNWPKEDSFIPYYFIWQ